jgi:hypothetical protein
MNTMLAAGDGALLVNLVVALAFGGVSAAIAVGRGRSGVGWFFIGFFFSCIGLVLLLCLPDLKAQQEREDRQRQENRRLREQIAKERMVADARHQRVTQRLGAHDQALGVDTDAAAQIDDGPEPPPLVADQPATRSSATRWYYARDGQRQGPVSAETLRHLLETATVSSTTLVWRQGMPDWAPLADVADLDGGAA